MLTRRKFILIFCVLSWTAYSQEQIPVTVHNTVRGIECEKDGNWPQAFETICASELLSFYDAALAISFSDTDGQDIQDSQSKVSMPLQNRFEWYINSIIDCENDVNCLINAYKDRIREKYGLSISVLREAIYYEFSKICFAPESLVELEFSEKNVQRFYSLNVVDDTHAPYVFEIFKISCSDDNESGFWASEIFNTYYQYYENFPENIEVLRFPAPSWSESKDTFEIPDGATSYFIGTPLLPGGRIDFDEVSSRFTSVGSNLCSWQFTGVDVVLEQCKDDPYNGN